MHNNHTKEFKIRIDDSSADSDATNLRTVS